MVFEDFLALAPLLVLAVAIVIGLLVAALPGSDRIMAGLTPLALVLALASLPFAAAAAPRLVTPLLLVDGFALVFSGLILVAALLVAVLSRAAFAGRPGRPPRLQELDLLLLLAVLGALVLTGATHMISFVIGLELLSIPLLALIAYPRDAPLPLEAGLKYLVIAGVSSATLFFGLALIYAATGTMDFAAIARTPTAHPAFVVAGLVLVLVAGGFKLSLIPFHMWAPDVYQGAPAPVTALVGTVSKAAVFALLFRLFEATGALAEPALLWSLSAIAFASMIGGNLLALFQKNVKRLLAYSSIAHFGYLMVPLLAGGAFRAEAGIAYLAGYSLTLIGALAVVGLLRPDASGREAYRWSDYQGLFRRRPWLAGLFALMLLSLAGIPLTLGFIAKLYAFAAGIEGAAWLLLAGLVAGSTIGLFYYLRLVLALFASAGGGAAATPQAPLSLPARGLLAVLAVALVGLGVWPQPLIGLIREAGGPASTELPILARPDSMEARSWTEPSPSSW